MWPLLNFLLTFIIELIIFYLFFRKNYLKTAFYVLFINLFTWPIANLIYSVWPFLFFIEMGVLIIEGFFIMLLFKFNWKKAFLISFVANFISSLVGLILS